MSLLQPLPPWWHIRGIAQCVDKAQLGLSTESKISLVQGFNFVVEMEEVVDPSFSIFEIVKVIARTERKTRFDVRIT